MAAASQIGFDDGFILDDILRFAARDYVALVGSAGPAQANVMMTSMMCSTITIVMPISWILRNKAVSPVIRSA